MVEEYFAAVKEWPDSWQLQRLANEILREELKDKHIDKVTQSTYPILSEHQLKHRRSREVPVGIIKGSYDNRIVGRKSISVESKNGGIYDKKQPIYDLSGSK